MSVLLFIFDKTGKLVVNHSFSSNVSDEKLSQSLTGFFSVLFTNTSIVLGKSNQIKSIIFANSAFSIFESDNKELYAVIKHSLEVDHQLMELIAKEILKQDRTSMKSKSLQVLRNPISNWIDSLIVGLSKKFRFNYIYVFWSKDRHATDNIALYPKSADYTIYSEVKDGVFKNLFKLEELVKERRSELLLEFDSYVGIFFFIDCITVYTQLEKELYTNENYSTITEFVNRIKSVNLLLKSM